MERTSSPRRPAQRGVRRLAAGQYVFRQGDPSGPMYMVMSGSVRVVRESDGVHPPIELARMGPGGHFGEMASLLGESRSASVQAVAATELVEVTPEQMRSLMRTNAAFARAIARGLMERGGLSASQAAAVATNPELHAREHDGDGGEARAEEHEHGPLPVPPHDADALYVKEVTCPACSTTYFALRVRPNKDVPYSTDTDFHEVYRSGPNPADYAVWVCPSDLYASFSDDFFDLTAEQRAQVPAVVGRVVANLWDGERPEFNVDRNASLREKSLQLALAFYEMRAAPPRRLAATQHRLAWCARERGDTAAERRRLGEALVSYRATYTASDLESPKAEIRLAYLCGELALRLGEMDEAVRWFWQVTRHPSIKDYPVWERKARERWALAREEGGSARPHPASSGPEQAA